MTPPSPQRERRRAPRAVAEFPIRFSQHPDAAPAMLRDISEIGLACTSPRDLPEMTLVGLDFSLPGNDTVHKVVGAIVRCEPQQSGDYDVAVYFTEVPPKTKAALSAYVAKAAPAP